MVRHVITARGQTLRVDVPSIVQHGLNSDEIELDLDETWDGLSIVLTLGEGDGARSTVYAAPVTIPSALMEDVGYLPVTVTGYGDGGRVRILSERASHLLRVVPSGHYDEGSSADSEDGWDGEEEEDEDGPAASTSDYEALANLPSINGVTVIGAAESLEHYGAASLSDETIANICV